MPVLDVITTTVQRLLGTTNDAMVRRLWPTVQKVRALEAALQGEDDTALRARADALRDKAKGAGPDAVMIEALALARETADRRIGMWNAIAGDKALPDADWADALSAVQAARARLAEEAAKPADDPTRGGPWAIDLPAAAYRRIRTLYPESRPPYRMRAHDVQILGALVLHQGKIAEMRTGEGKTLVASLCAFANAIAGVAVHVITVNDYLAARDAAWNAPTFRFLGLTVGAIQSQMPPWVRKEIYAGHVVYGTNNEFGFDYLRDNLAKSVDEQVQTRREMAIVDEVDSVLIDEARTPLIISGPATNRKAFYDKADEVARQLVVKEHFEIDIKDRHVTLTEAGMDRAAELFGVSNLYDPEHMHLPHFLDNAMKAHQLYHKDKEYLVVGGQVKIIDEHTGRTMEGRRWSDGLHQAIEAKEQVPVQEENQTYATITLQNFFRLYKKLAGMTGTAMTEASEFNAIYKLDVVAVPPNRPVIRADLADLIFGSEKEKFEALVEEIATLHAFGQPVLVGTISVAVSERLSEVFTRRGVPHEVLNARQHAREAEIVAKAGRFGAVTIATNMAGRGTDIVLGEIPFAEALAHWGRHELAPKKMQAGDASLDEAVVECWARRVLDAAALAKATTTEARLKALNAKRKSDGLPPMPLPSQIGPRLDVRVLGGLRIVGTERHDSRRIDNQLRGRSGRQGDPGSSRFYLSLDDDLMKRFAGPAMANLMRRLGLKDGIPIESPMVSRSVEKAQKRVEEYHYGIRKNLLEYDQVANTQRLLIYRTRQGVLEGRDLDTTLVGLYRGALDDLVQRSAEDGTRGAELEARIRTRLGEEFGLNLPPETAVPVKEGGDAVVAVLVPQVEKALAARKESFGPVHDQIQRFVLLDTIDRRWKDHLYAMDHLRHAIGLESYAQKDPRMRFKEEGFRLFEQMNALIRQDVARVYLRLELQAEPAPVDGPAAGLEAGGFAPRGATLDETPAGRPKANDPCPCGSGKPFRTCHGP